MTLKSMLKFVVSFSILSNMLVSVHSAEEQNQELIINSKWLEERNQKMPLNQELSEEQSQEEDYQELREAKEREISEYISLALFSSDSGCDDYISDSWKEFYTTHPQGSQSLPKGHQYNIKGDIVPK